MKTAQPKQPLPPSSWTCPKCRRVFTRKNQRHACGTGERADVLANRPAWFAALYSSIESFARSLGPVELVTRERYVLFRTTRIFADLVIMKDAVRLAIHLDRKVAHPLFSKVAADRRHVTHVASLRTERDFTTLKPYFEEAHAFSVARNSEKT